MNLSLSHNFIFSTIPLLNYSQSHFVLNITSHFHYHIKLTLSSISFSLHFYFLFNCFLFNFILSAVVFFLESHCLSNLVVSVQFTPHDPKIDWDCCCGLRGVENLCHWNVAFFFLSKLVVIVEFILMTSKPTGIFSMA